MMSPGDRDSDFSSCYAGIPLPASFSFICVWILDLQRDACSVWGFIVDSLTARLMLIPPERTHLEFCLHILAFLLSGRGGRNLEREDRVQDARVSGLAFHLLSISRPCLDLDSLAVFFLPFCLFTCNVYGVPLRWDFLAMSLG
ncbi:hypothetical protein VTN00DRAFT_5994 [Thermoascus crustaceus]|uniref:uncharacterized protein n=1 Tax=Thermoascus crustaceus TaxID=5088 RepID=UPI0037429851